MKCLAGTAVLFLACAAVSPTSALASPPLPINPGLVDAMRPAAPRTDQLSLTELEDRVRETRVIPPLQKLQLKAEVDELRAQFRSAHESGEPRLESLREPYERLMTKLQGMVRKDRQLARDLAASKEPIWGVLTDRTQFAALR